MPACSCVNASRVPPPPPSPVAMCIDKDSCADCTAYEDKRCPGPWCDQQCVFLSKPVEGGHRCQPASWWSQSKAKYPGTTCSGNGTDCQACAKGVWYPPGTPSPANGGDGRAPTGGIVRLVQQAQSCECELSRHFASGTLAYYNATSWRIAGCASDSRDCKTAEACDCIGVSVASCVLWADGSTTETSGCELADGEIGNCSGLSGCGEARRAGSAAASA